MVRSFTARALVALGVAVGGVATALVVTAPVASAAATPTLSPATVQRGTPTTMSGTGCMSPAQPQNPASLIVTGGAFVGYATASPTDGNWSIAVDVGEQIGPGNFAIRARCSYPGSGGFDYPPVTLTVVGDPLPPKSWELPPPPGGRSGPAPTALPSPEQPSTARTSTPPRPAPSAVPNAAPVASPPTPPAAATASPATPSAASDCSDCEQLGAGEAVRAGAKLALRYAGFQPGEQVTLVMRSTPVALGTFTADADGVVTADVTVPASAEPGAHTLTLSGRVTGDLVVAFRLAAASERETAAASDGTDLTRPLALGGSALVVLLGVGGVLVHRRRTATSGQEAATPIAAPTA